MARKIYWHHSHERILRDLYETTPIKVIAAKLQKPSEQIKDRARLLGLKSLPRHEKKRTLYFYDGTPKFRVKKNGCWEWIAARNAKGYALDRGKDTTLAHRQIYIDAHGEIPASLDVDHTCKNRACVNIEHLELVPHIVNVRRSKRTLLSPEMAERIRANKSKTTRELARELNVTYNAVYFARRGDSWKA